MADMRNLLVIVLSIFITCGCFGEEYNPSVSNVVETGLEDEEMVIPQELEELPEDELVELEPGWEIHERIESKEKVLNAVWKLDNNLSPEQVEAILDAAEQWAALAPGRLNWSFEFYDLGREAPRSIKLESEPCNKTDIRGCYMRGPKSIEISPNLGIKQFRKTITHEMGHALGIKHISRENCQTSPIMLSNSSHAKSAELTDCDKAAFHSVWDNYLNPPSQEVIF